MAPNAEAALMLARSSEKVVCADRDSVRGKLAKLPVSLLPCEAKTLAVLNRWGIRTLGELATLPETALISRLGQQGRRLQQLARGEADYLLVPEEPEFRLSEATALDSPLELLDSLLFVLSPMLEAILSKYLRKSTHSRHPATAPRVVPVPLSFSASPASLPKPATNARSPSSTPNWEGRPSGGVPCSSVIDQLTGRLEF